MNDYNVLAKFLTDKYIDRVSGRDFPERIVGEDPDKVVMAGTMAEDRNEETFEGGYREDLSKQFESIPSISLSFHIDKKSEGSMRIIPRGLLFIQCCLHMKRSKTILFAFSQKEIITFISPLKN